MRAPGVVVYCMRCNCHDATPPTEFLVSVSYRLRRVLSSAATALGASPPGLSGASTIYITAFASSIFHDGEWGERLFRFLVEARSR